MSRALVFVSLLLSANAYASPVKERRAAPVRQLTPEQQALVSKGALARPPLNLMRQAIERAGFADAAKNLQPAPQPAVLDARTTWDAAHGSFLDAWDAARADPQSNTILFGTAGGAFVTFRATPGTVYVVTYYATGKGLLTARVGNDNVTCNFVNDATACMVALRAKPGESLLTTWAFSSALWVLNRVEISPAP